jgi:catechol-2,3-dioxygenase
LPVLGFNHYNLRADREMLERLRAFYCEVVGMTVGPRVGLSSFGYWLYIGEKDVLHLSETRVDEKRLSDTETTFDHVAFTAANFEEMEQVLVLHQVTYRTRTLSDGTRQVFFKDPAGNGVELNFSENNV